jgi:hypothetical protein
MPNNPLNEGEQLIQAIVVIAILAVIALAWALGS